MDRRREGPSWGCVIKILFIGNYRDGTGWAEACCRHALALDEAGADVVCRPVRLNDCREDPPERVLQLEAKSSRGCDAVVQFLLPHLMEYDGHFLSAGMYLSESDSVLHNGWADRLNCMDLAIGASSQMREAALSSGVRVPYEVVPIPADTREYAGPFGELEELKPLKRRGEFVFYTVGEYVRRKNLGTLLRAFHAEFDPDEPVSLLIKASVPGKGERASASLLRSFCEDVRANMRLYADGSRYKGEVIVTRRLSRAEILSLHAGSDCFVQPSYAEGWSQPGFDAMAMGKTPLVTDWGGFREYLTAETGWPLPFRVEPAFGARDAIGGLHTSRENWASVSVNDLRRAMRAAYSDVGLRKQKARAGVLAAEEFSLRKVGERLLGVLSSHVEVARLRGLAGGEGHHGREGRQEEA